MAEVLKTEYSEFVWKVNSSCQCDGCARQIRNAFRSYPGVCAVNIGGKTMKNVDAVKLKTEVKKQLKEKLKKKVEITSPQTPKKLKKVSKPETSSVGPEIIVELSARVCSSLTLHASARSGVTITMN